jgi:hypothetical protein
VLDEVAQQPGEEAEQERDPEPEAQAGGDLLVVGGTAEVRLVGLDPPDEPAESAVGRGQEPVDNPASAAVLVGARR